MSKQSKSGDTLESLKAEIRAVIQASEDPIAVIAEIRDCLHQASPLKDQPVNNVRWVPMEKVRANNWNPNAHAPKELELLHTSIAADHYTQPIVTVYDPASDCYTVVDGFHRSVIMRTYKDIEEMTKGLLPVVVIDRPISDLMASTVRHNRARGSHSVSGMSQLVFSMLENGETDEQILEKLGMQPEELVRLKHITGFSKLFESVEYQKMWETRKQIRLRLDYEMESGKKIYGGVDGSQKA